MTPLPTAADLARRKLYNPEYGTVHIIDLINRAKDGIYNKDILSDYLIGAILLARHLGIITAWEGSLFQLPFVEGLKLRKAKKQYGLPFVGPGHKVLTMNGRMLYGGEVGREWDWTCPMDREVSGFGVQDLKGHPEYERWLSVMLFAGKGRYDTSYVRTRTENSKAAVDKYVNGKEYEAGPESAAIS